MALTLPPDPYKILGVLKDAKLPEIRSAHRKLVLKCHPDKVQDAALKAVKQDEFQKVQQAYELLSDDNRRLQYDEQVKLFELRKEMGRGVATPRSNPFEYEVKTAEPRPSTYAPKPTAAKPTSAKPTTPKSAPSTKPYERPVPRSYEDLYEEIPRPTARASKSQEYERKRPSAREEEKERIRRERKLDEERAKYEKELKRASEKSKKREKERSGDKERKRASEDKYARNAYVEEDTSDDYHVSSRSRSTEKKLKQRMMEEEIRIREEAARTAEKAMKEESERTRKMNDHKDFAAQYMQAARRKVQPPIEEDFEPRTIRRAETFAAPSPSYNIRYATPTTPNPNKYADEEESPRRSSARSSRRASEAPQSSSRSRDVPKTSAKESRRRSPTSHPRDPYIVEPPSPPPLQSHKSAPPVITASRKEPARSKTMQQLYGRAESGASPPLPRASTFQSGDRGRGGSKLKTARGYTSDSSDSDSPGFTPAPKMRSPSPPRHRHAAPEPTRYIIDNGRSVPVRSHRSELREDSYAEARDRSESPRGGRHTTSEHTRPPLTRPGASGSGSHSRQAPRSSSHSHSQAYYPPDPPEPPVVIPVRPKMPTQQPAYRGTSSQIPAVNYNQVKFAPSYGPEHVVYTPHVPEQYRRGSEQTRGYDQYPSVRGERVGLYA